MLLSGTKIGGLVKLLAVLPVHDIDVLLVDFHIVYYVHRIYRYNYPPSIPPAMHPSRHLSMLFAIPPAACIVYKLVSIHSNSRDGYQQVLTLYL